MSSQALQQPAVRTRPLSLLLISYFMFISIALPDGVLSIAWTYMKDEFGVPLEALGVSLGVGMVARLVTAFTSGILIKRFGIARFVTGGVLLMILGYVCYASASSWLVLLVAVAIASMGSGAIDAGLNTFVSAGYTTGQLNWLHAAYGVGVTIGPILATYTIVTAQQSWRMSYWLVLIPMVLGVVLLIATRSGWTLRLADPQASAPASATLMQSLRLPLVLLGGLMFILYGAVEIGAGNLANTLFVEGRLAPQETASFWISLYWASFTIGRILIGFVADRINADVLMRACMVGSVIGAAMLMLNPIPIIGFLGIAVMGFSFAPMFATLISLTPRRVGEAHAANAIGIQVGVVGLGGAGLPFLAGILSRSFGLEVIGVILFIGAVLLLLVNEWIIFTARRTPQAG